MKRKFTLLIAALALLTMIVQPGRAWGQTPETFTFSELGYSNGAEVTTVNGTNVTLTFAKGTNSSNAPKYYDTGTAVRMYTGNTLEIALNDQQGESRITAIDFTFSGTYTGSLQNWTGSETSVSFTNTASGQARIQVITVTYTEGGTPVETVATPTFDPAAGSYTEAQSVNISCETDGATIYYTTDGNAPTTSSDVYSTALSITETTTVKAMAVKEGMNNSAVATAAYTINTPYTGDPYVRITELSNLTDGATVIIAARYNSTESSYYAMTAATTGKPTGVSFTSTTSSNGECLPSSILNEEDTYSWTVGINSNGYTFTNANNQVLGYNSGTNFATGGNNTEWTITRTTAGNSAMVGGYQGFYIVNKNNTGRGIALNNQHNYGPYATSNNNSSDYNFYLDIFVQGYAPASVATPTFSPVAGSYIGTQNVTISCETGGSTIYYTTDGSVPSNQSTQYNGAITVSETTTIKAIAYVGSDASAVATATYSIVTPFTTMQAIFDDATTTPAEHQVYITFDNWVITGANTSQHAFLSDNTKGCIIYGTDHGFTAGDVLSGTAQCKIQLYHESVEITELTNTTTGLTVTPDGNVSVANIPMANLTGVNTGALVSYENLICEERTEGNYTNYYLSDGDTEIQVYRTLFNDYANYLEDGKTYNITGVFVLNNTTKRVNPRSADDIEEVIVVTPVISAENVEITYDATSGTITYEIENYVAGNMTASTEATWISDFTYQQVDEIGEVGFTTTENDGVARQATVTLTYTYNTNQTVTKDVTVSQAAAPVPSITVTPATVNAPYTGETSTLALTYQDITITGTDDFGIQYYDANNEPLSSEPDWLLVVVEAGQTSGYVVSYTIGENDSDARTAYFKVFAMNGEEFVYSNLVTINQAAGATPPTPGQYNWVLTSLTNLTSDDVFVIVGDNGATYAMSNDNGTSSAPAAVEVTVEDEKLSGSIAENIQWNLSTSDDGYTFYPNGSTETWLYCTNTNNGVRIGTNNNKIFILDESGYLKHVGTSRYVGIFNSQDWRCYTGTDGNIASQTFAFYKRVPVSTEPSITLEQYTYDINSNGGNATLPVTYNNMPTNPQATVIFYEANGTTPLTVNPTWITAIINGNNNVNGNIQANTGEARSAYFKVKGIDADNNEVYSDLVTINQAAYVLSIVFETTELDIEVGGEQDRVLSFEYQGFGENPTFDVRQYDATGQTHTTYEWLTTTITQGHKVNIKVDANTGAARSGYFKVYGSDGTVNIESNLVTINQAEYVAPTYSVTYDANGGTGTMTDPNSPYTENTEVTLLENTFGAPEGKIWDSWLVKDANQTTIEVNEGKFNMPASNVTVTAQWIDNPIVPTYEWVLTALEDLTSSDVFVIVGNNGSNYAMTNNNGTTSAPSATAVNIANNKLSNDPEDNLKWNISGNATDGYIFYPDGSTTTWLYCYSNNNGLRVGNSTDNTFEVKDDYLYNQGQERYIGIYNSSDWRSYTSINNNIKDQTFGFYKRQVASTDPQLSANDVNIASDETEGEITYTLENPVSGGELTAEITDGNEGNWLTLGTIGENIPFTCSANTEATSRTATVTLTYTYDAKTSITATAVVTQAALVIDYATIPFAFDGGRADIENVNGLTQEGLDSDYGSSPKLKFNSTDDWMILKLNEAPKSLSYDIKGNGFSDNSVFTVQTSADGVNYVDLATYTTLGDVQSITHVDLDADVRYIKWIYTKKKTGNVALGNIHATEHYDTYGDVTFNSLDLTNSSESLIVHSGSVVTVTGALVNNSADKLLVKDGGQLILPTSSKATAEVYATVEKDIVAASEWGSNTTADNWYTISSPMFSELTATDVTGLITTGEGYDYDLYRYDEANNYWRNYKQNNFAIEPSRGYLYASQHGTTISYAGIINDDDVNCPVTKTADGFNLIGNPFTQNITMENIDGATLAGGYILQKAGNWKSDVDLTVAPCQGFLVQVQESTELTISRTTSGSKSRANRDYIGFTVANGQYEDVTYALFEDAIGLDKINHLNSEIPMIYIPQDGTNYAIATMDDDTKAFNLNFKAMTTGQYTLSFKAQGSYSYLHVIDRLTGEDIDMLFEGEYNFIGSPRDNEARFIVKLDYSANIDELEVSDSFAYQSGDVIIVNGEGTLQVFDVMGRFVRSININGSESINASEFSTGVYVFRMVGNDVKAQKVVIR